MKNLYLISLSLIVLVLTSCSSGRKLDPQALNKLKEGMTMVQVKNLLGPPEHVQRMQQGTESWIYSHMSMVGFAGFHSSKMNTLTLQFSGSKLTDIQKSNTKGGGFWLNNKTQTEWGNYSNSPTEKSVPQKPTLPGKTKTSSSGSYEDKKKQLLDMYLQKEITKEEYFELRRELDKTK